MAHTLMSRGNGDIILPRCLGKRSRACSTCLFPGLFLAVRNTATESLAYILAASESHLRVEEGSLYPALRRLEADGLIRAEWRPTENNRRARYYSLSKAGEKRLAHEVKRWREHANAVAAFLDLA